MSVRLPEKAIYLPFTGKHFALHQVERWLSDAVPGSYGREGRGMKIAFIC
jgi:hypothetical protein